MPILNDYRCRECDAVQEAWTASPAPAEVPCAACGAPARRLLAAVRLGGRASAAASTSPAPRAPRPSLCSQYPQVPGLCHMSESAGRMWVAKYQRNTAAVERELARQEARAAEKPLTRDDAISHNHHEAPAPPVAAAT